MLFFQEQYQYLAQHNLQQEEYEVGQFTNQEFCIKLEKPVQGQRVVVVGSLTAPADQALQLLLLLHTLKMGKPQEIILFSPYLGYQRQDHQKNLISHGLQFADAMLQSAGINRIIALDIHSQLVLTQLQIPMLSISMQQVFFEEMHHYVNVGFGFVFPDLGSAQRYTWVAEVFPQATQAYFIKTRTQETKIVQLESFSGKVCRKVLLCDDILDSGITLVQCCIALKSMGVEEIVIFITHGFFHGILFDELWQLGVKFLYCTDSLPSAHQINHAQIKVKSISFLLQKFI